MLATTTVDRPLTLAPMSQKEAEQITSDIKNNFDSLGSMLMQARDRKAYKALGYSSFEEYCHIEFGKSKSRAYQLIEDTKVVEKLSLAMSEELGQEVQIKIPSSHLQPLKKLSDVSLQIQAIKQANAIASGQGKKTNKQYIELAVCEIGGVRSEDFREAIKALGFTVGTEVEIRKNNYRGFVRRIDKSGKIQVQIHTGGAAFIPYGCEELRILQPDEKPKTAINEFTSKGSKVKIYSNNLAGKTGKITENLIGSSRAKVKIDDDDAKIIELPYAELELIEELPPEAKSIPDWETSIWNDGGPTYIYDKNTGYITCRSWPAGLFLEPYRKEEFDDAKEFFYWWKDNEGARFFGGNLESPKALGISFGKTLPELLSGQKTQTRRAWQDSYAQNFIRYWEQGIEIPALDKQRQYGGQEVGKIRLTEKPCQELLSEMPLTDLVKEGAVCATVREFIDTYFEGKDQLVWVINFEFLPPDSNQQYQQEILRLTNANAILTAQLKEAEEAIEEMVRGLKSVELVEENSEEIPVAEAAQNPDLQVENSTIATFEETFSSEILERVEARKQRLLHDLAQATESIGTIRKRKDIKNTDNFIARTKQSIKELDKFLQFRVGQKVYLIHKIECTGGEIKGVSLSLGGMPGIFVLWPGQASCAFEMLTFLAAED